MVENLTSPDAEQAVIGSMLIDPRCVGGVMEILSEADFVSERCQKAFAVCKSKFAEGQPIDALTVIEALKSSQGYSDEDIRRYLMGVVELTPTAANVATYAEEVRKYSKLRQAYYVFHDAEDKLFAERDPDTLTDEVISELYGIREDATKGLIKMSDAVMQCFGNLDEQTKGTTGRIDTGMSDIDRMLGGMLPGNLIVIGARPGIGKTMFALTIAKNAALHGKKVLFHSLEMEASELAERLLVSEGGVSFGQLINFTPKEPLPDATWDKLAQNSSRVSPLDILIDEKADITPAYIRRRAQTVKGLSLIIVDYLQLMSSDGKHDNRNYEISAITRNLKIMAKQLNVPILLLSQLNRTPESRSEAKPTLADLRDSGAIEQDANKVLMMWEAEEKQFAKVLGISIAKNRRGQTGDAYAYFNGDGMRFTGMEKGYKPPDKRRKKNPVYDEGGNDD